MLNHIFTKITVVFCQINSTLWLFMTLCSSPGKMLAFYTSNLRNVARKCLQKSTMALELGSYGVRKTERQTDNQSEQRNVTSTATVSDAMVWNGDSPL